MNSQYGFIKGQSCKTNLILFCDSLTGFSKALDSFPHDVPIKKVESVTRWNHHSWFQS